MADKLKISDIARLMRTSTDTIRFYEKKGIIKPQRYEDNNYRSFSLEDIRRLYDCKLFQNLEFSLSEISDIIEDTSLDDFYQLIDQKEVEIQKVIKRYKLMQDRIDRYKAAAFDIKKYFNTFQIKECPHVIIFPYAGNNKLNMTSLNNSYYQLVMDYHNLFDCTVLIPKQYAASFDIENRSQFAFSIDFKKAKKLSIKSEKPIIEYAAKKCAYTIVKANPVINHSSLVKVLDMIEKNNYKISGNIFCRVIALSFNNGVSERFYEIWCPIE